MGYYDNQAEYDKRGIDWDLEACLEYNPQSFTVDDIEVVLAVWEGENDGDDWRWILQLKDGRFVFLQGGCDYTGWDCQSSAVSIFADTAIDATIYASTGTNDKRYTCEADQTVYLQLFEQIEKGDKLKTWREKMDSEFKSE